MKYVFKTKLWKPDNFQTQEIYYTVLLNIDLNSEYLEHWIITVIEIFGNISTNL